MLIITSNEQKDDLANAKKVEQEKAGRPHKSKAEFIRDGVFAIAVTLMVFYVIKCL